MLVNTVTPFPVEATTWRAIVGCHVPKHEKNFELLFVTPPNQFAVCAWVFFSFFLSLFCLHANRWKSESHWDSGFVFVVFFFFFPTASIYVVDTLFRSSLSFAHLWVFSADRPVGPLYQNLFIIASCPPTPTPTPHSAMFTECLPPPSIRL